MAKRIIPCLDTTLDAQGKAVVVKGIEFEKLRYAGDPVELAMRYDAQGADELVFLDISASHEGRDTMVSVVEKIAERVSIPLCVGGGIKSIDINCCIYLSSGQKRFPLFELIFALEFKPQDLILEPWYFQV